MLRLYTLMVLLPLIRGRCWISPDANGHVVVPNATVDQWSFAGCLELKTIDLSAVVTIGTYAFRNCDQLESITISSNISYIGRRAFRGCANLPWVLIPNAGCTVWVDAFEVNGFGFTAPLPPPTAPPLPPPPTSGAIIEMTGDQPKIIFGTLETPICELSLDRTNAELVSSCSLQTGRRLEESMEAPLSERLTALEQESADLKAQLADIKKQLAEIKPQLV